MKNRLVVHIGCNMVEWFWWDSSLISTTKWFNPPGNDQCVWVGR